MKCQERCRDRAPSGQLVMWRWTLGPTTALKVRLPYAPFNHHRLFSPIGHIPPAEAGANYYAANETLDMVA